MNTGVISSRYAKALLLLTQETGRGEQVFDQARALLRNPDVAPSPLEPDLAKLVALLHRNGRGSYLKLILNTFVRMYCFSTNTRLAHLTTAVPAEGLEEKLSKLISEKTGLRVITETEVDPRIVGGFILDIDDYMLDASVQTQIDRIKAQFIEKNNRIV